VFKAMIIKFFIKVFSFSINAKMMYSIVFMFIMLLKMFKSIKHVEFDTKHIIINRLIKSHKNVTKYLIWSLNTKNWTRSLYIKFKKCLSKITRLSCDSTFCLIIVHDSQRFLFAMSLIKFIFTNVDARFALSNVLIEHVTRSECFYWSWSLTRLTTSRNYRR
jgi:hypothetical protein